MPSEPIDPSNALKSLFERRRDPTRTAPMALFRATASSGVSSTAPATEPPAAGAAGRAGPLRHALRRLSAQRKKRQRIIGLDLGAGAVKVARVEREDGRLRLTGLALEELPEGVHEGPDWDRAVRELLHRLKRQGLLSGPVVLGFHHSEVFVESIRMPKMPLSELGQAVPWEAGERLSLNPERSVIRFVVTGEVVIEGHPQLEVLVVAAPKDSLMAQWRMLADAGLRVSAIEPISLAPFYCLSGLRLWRPAEWVGLLEIGLQASHLSFVKGQTVYFARSFRFAGDSMTRSIADYCQADYGEAERLKRQYGVSPMALEEDRKETGHEADERVRVSHALGLHMERLVSEIEQAYRYLAFEMGRTEGRQVDRLIVTGGGGLLLNLPEFLTHRLSVPVTIADPLQGMEMDPAHRDRLQAGWTQRLAASIGLALRPV